VLSIKRSRCVKHQAGQDKSGTQSLLQPSLPLQGRAGRAGPPYMQERRATNALMERRRSIRPQLAGHRGDGRAPRAGCLPLALRATLAPARTQPRARPHGRGAATSALARGTARGPSLRRPHPEALQDHGQGRAYGASLRDPFGPLDRESWQGFRGRLSEGWLGPSQVNRIELAAINIPNARFLVFGQTPLL
jgi:hypothetical protein